MRTLWESLRGDSSAIVLVVVVLAYTYLRANDVDDLGLFEILAGMLVAKIGYTAFTNR